MEEVRRHPWFRSIDWEKLEAKELVPPFVPDVRRSAIISCSVLITLLLVQEGKL